jgi:hypothetical protein
MNQRTFIMYNIILLCTRTIYYYYCYYYYYLTDYLKSKTLHEIITRTLYSYSRLHYR